MPRIPGFVARERLSVEPYTGAGAHGDVYGAPVTVRAAVEPMVKLVTSGTGREATSELAAYVRPTAIAIPVESKVTFAGRLYRVLAAAPWPLGSGHELLLGGFV